MLKDEVYVNHLRTTEQLKENNGMIFNTSQQLHGVL
jgi:hypothetical protein